MIKTGNIISKLMSLTCLHASHCESATSRKQQYHDTTSNTRTLQMQPICRVASLMNAHLKAHLRCTCHTFTPFLTV